MPVLTHKGCFLLCPVNLADMESNSPYMETRRFIPEWWFWINFGVVNIFLFVAELMGYEPLYPIMITGEIDNGTSS